MRLYLVQHGDALPKELDPQRSLSDQGRAEVQRLAGFLQGWIRVARILHSGKTRARQTAELLAAQLAPDIPLQAAAGLDPLDPVEPFARQIADWTDDTLVAGHQPFLGKLVARLVTGAEEPAIVAYEPGALVCLERSAAQRWSLLWMLNPKLLKSPEPQNGADPHP